MKLDVYTIKSNRDGFDDIARIAEESRSARLETVELDFSCCHFFEANMAAPLYAVIAGLRDELNNVSITRVFPFVEEALRKNHFLTFFARTALPDIYQTTLPFKIFKRQASEQFADYLKDYMNGRGIPKMSMALTKHFLRSLFEIFQNAAIHSQSESGIFTCGQFYLRKQRVDFSIADAGVGILENVWQYTGNRHITSCDAIKWALVEGHTTKTGKHPGGLGLKLIKEFISLNKGKLQIVSRFGYYEFSAAGESSAELNHDFPGTCINIEINTQDTDSYCLASESNTVDIF